MTKKLRATVKLFEEHDDGTTSLFCQLDNLKVVGACQIQMSTVATEQADLIPFNDPRIERITLEAERDHAG